MSDAEFQAYRAAYRRGLEARSSDPPTDDELAALVTGEISEGERDRVLSAMLRSSDAMDRYGILKELHEAAQSHGSNRRRWIQAISVAAGLMLAVSVGTLALQEPVSQHRGGQASRASPSGNVRLREPPQAYRWSAELGARRYRVQIFDNAAEIIWRSPWVTGPELIAPEGPELRLKSGARYFWTVEVDGAGARRELGPYWFRLD